MFCSSKRFFTLAVFIYSFGVKKTLSASKYGNPCRYLELSYAVNKIHKFGNYL